MTVELTSNSRIGSRVRTYDEFVGYLQHKYALRLHTLPFEGKNKVLYSLGSDHVSMPSTKLVENIGHE